MARICFVFFFAGVTIQLAGCFFDPHPERSCPPGQSNQGNNQCWPEERNDDAVMAALEDSGAEAAPETVADGGADAAAE